MKHQEHYRKYKANYPVLVYIPGVIWAIGVAALVEPFIVLNKAKRAGFSLYDYFNQLQYFLLLILPIGLFLTYTYWKESVKRQRGFRWVGKFRVIDKKALPLKCYLFLYPGSDHKITVQRDTFSRVKIGDFIIIRRDSLGKIEKINHVNNWFGRLKSKSRFN